MLSQLPKRSVLSHYPQSWTNKVENHIPVNDTPIPLFSFYSYKSHNRLIDRNNLFVQGLSVAGGFMFMKGEALLEVPYDRNLDWVFNGEEFLFSARLYTHGYDFFSPSKNLAYHHYEREGEPKFHEDHRFSMDTPIKTVENRITNPPPGYFGNIRTVNDYMEFLKQALKY
jgi:hypothetical protein